jgi:DNA-binding GntR family transcriptional regulator
MVQIERDAPKLLYGQIVQWMNRQVDTGAWPEHYKLQSETELAARLGVNRGTVRKAIAELVAQGRLISIHGRGTFVASQTLEQPLAERLIAFSEDLLEKGIPFETRVLDQSVIVPPHRVASLLSLAPEAKVFFLKRVRVVAQLPLILLHNYVVCDRCPGIETVDFTRHRLLETLERRYKL